MNSATSLVELFYVAHNPVTNHHIAHLRDALSQVNTPQTLEHCRNFAEFADTRQDGNLAHPIDLYYWPTPTGWKIAIALAELELPYNLHLVDINKGDQFKPDFLKISPNNRMPAIVDADGPDGAPISIFESGAILQYLARKSGRFFGSNEREQIEINQWLMWQIGGLGPMAGQAHHFIKFAPSLDPPIDLPPAKDRYRNEVARLLGVLERQLAGRNYVCGAFSIADMAIWPWASLWKSQEQDIALFPNVAEWIDRCLARPGVSTGRALAAEKRSSGKLDAKAQKVLFGGPAPAKT